VLARFSPLRLGAVGSDLWETGLTYDQWPTVGEARRNVAQLKSLANYEGPAISRSARLHQSRNGRRSEEPQGQGEQEREALHGDP